MINDVTVFFANKMKNQKARGNPCGTAALVNPYTVF